MRTIAFAALAATASAKLTPKEIGEVSIGVVEGFFSGHDFGSLTTCVSEIKHVEEDSEKMIEDFKEGGLHHIIAGVKELGTVAKEAKKALADCEAISTDNWGDLEKAIKLIKHPISFVFHVGKDILVNGKQIYHDIEDAKSNWDAGSYNSFGRNVGDAIEKVFVGEEEEVEEEEIFTYYGLSRAQTVDVLKGVLKGALEAEGGDDLLTCLGDSDKVIEDLNAAYHDLKKHTVAGKAKGIKELGEALEEAGSAVTDCQGVKKDFETIVAWAKSFTNPASLVIHLGKDILLNGTQIYDDIEDAVTQWNAQSYEKFGEDVGDALAKVIVGMDDLYVVQ